uniref:Uncharacterized protein n=1 Tax=Periophthalmus magnuspinnatus TaxID=409849 RepID=A0A3B4AM90_9GOBI
MDTQSALVDEVALEGLDGITLPSLWLRLEDRKPKFPQKIDDFTKAFLWRCLVHNPEISFYEQPQERDDVELYDRFKSIDPDTGIEFKGHSFENRKDVYPAHFIMEHPAGIQGSCVFFTERKDVTRQIRSASLSPLLNLDQAWDRFGRRLVVVASLKVRFRALIGTESEPELKLSDESYCVLERVGRSRWQGELQRDLSNGPFKIEARKIHYLRKSLVQHSLVTVQSHVCRLSSGTQQHSCLLLLRRFHPLVNRRSKYDILMERVSNILEASPGQHCTQMALREHLNVDERSFKRIFQYMRASKLVELFTTPLQDLDSESGPCLNKRGMTSVQVRCIKLLKPFSKKNVPDDDEDEEEEGADVRPEGCIMERDVLSQAYNMVVLSGTKGLTCVGLGAKMNVGKLERRMICRQLEREGVIKVSHLYPPNMEELCAQAGGVIWRGEQRKTQSAKNKRETYKTCECVVSDIFRYSEVFEIFYCISDNKYFVSRLQKIISAEEKRLGFSTKCCKKTILRLVQTLAREGLVKLYTTTVIQDGLTRKVDLYAHPSIQSSDEIVQRTIDQVRFKMSSSYSNTRVPEEEKSRGQSKDTEGTLSGQSKAQKQKKSTHKKDTLSNVNVFPLSSVRGLSKSFGYQPKMHRMRVVHNFLWYMVYGHPLRHNPETQAFEKSKPSQTSDPAEEGLKGAEEGIHGAEKGANDVKEGPQGAEQGSQVTEEGNNAAEVGEPCAKDEPQVYSEEEPWKKYIPPVKLHKDYSSGWVMLGDLILCLPLSIFVQVIQVNYKVDGLEDYLNDPEKEHYLVRCLPARMKRQLLYKRRYIFSFYENLVKLAYMGLIQFGPLEKFRDKDQVFIYVKRHATIVDTTSSEPHYWLVTEPPDQPFERRHYNFNTAEDIESFWFDLMCVCLNTPLGTAYRSSSYSASTHSYFQGPNGASRHTLIIRVSFVLGSLEVVDDGSIPGDGRGAGGLSSEFFAHLKRNWLWTNHLLAVKPVSVGTPCRRVRRYVVEEPACRKKQRMGGKQQKRKRQKKEVVRVPRKKKEPKKRSLAHDERDHEALKQMTRQRVYWSLQEDSLMMLCAVAARLLNSKLKRPFVPYCVVRDILHKEFEKSRDKTSLAVGRRTRYILKNPQTIHHYKCPIVVLFLTPLLSLCCVPQACAESFSEYVRLLRHKFSSTIDVSEGHIPDSKEDSEDIHAIVLHNLIQSTLAMTNSQMKSSRSFQMFHVYSSYSQELLCQVFIQCRKRGLVNRRRINQNLGPKKNRALPILPMSYQLSHAYYRCFSWRFPQVLCTDSFCFETENRAPDGDLVEPRKTSTDRKDKPEPTGVDSPDVSDMLQFSLEHPGGACVAALSLMSLGLLSVYLSIPKRMVVVDSALVDTDTVKSTLDEEEEDEEEAEETKKMEVKAHQASHTKYLMMKGYCAPGIGQHLLTLPLSSKKILQNRSALTPFYCKNIKHITFLNPCFPADPALDLSKCGPTLLPPGLSHSLSTPPLSAEECLLGLQEHRGYSTEDLQACTLLWDTLDQAGERGLDVGQFNQRHGELELFQPPRTRTVQQYMQVQGTGTKAGNHCWSQRVFPCVSSEEQPVTGSFFSLFFLLSTFYIHPGHIKYIKQDIWNYSPSESMSFVARPWRMVDGKLNRMVCKGMLEALLYHIMSVPGVTLEALLLHYRAVLQPLATLELLQALIDLGCVKRKTLVKRSKASLFSRPAPPPQTGPSTSSCGSREEQPDMVYYEPTVSCVLRLSQVLPHERHWNSDTPGQHPESTLTAP